MKHLLLPIILYICVAPHLLVAQGAPNTKWEKKAIYKTTLTQ